MTKFRFAEVGETQVAATPTSGRDLVGLILKPRELQHWKSPFCTYLTNDEARQLAQALTDAVEENES